MANSIKDWWAGVEPLAPISMKQMEEMFVKVDFEERKKENKFREHRYGYWYKLNIKLKKVIDEWG